MGQAEAQSEHAAGDPGAAVRREPELLSFVTHEIGNQLTVIGGFAEMLADGIEDLPPDMVREFAQAILRGAEQMRTLLQSVSDLRRLDAGGITVHPEATDLVPLVERTVDHCRVHLGTRAVDLVLPDRLVTYADPSRVQQILANLLTNAAKFTPATSSVTVELRLAGPDVQLSVTDNGPGVPPQRVAELFRRFSKPGPGTRGSGIGLFVSREAARAHGGDLVHLAQPAGARFEFRFPHQAA